MYEFQPTCTEQQKYWNIADGSPQNFGNLSTKWTNFAIHEHGNLVSTPGITAVTSPHSVLTPLMNC